MKKQDTNTRQERQMKFAEAGILFALILGLAIFLGVRINGDAEPIDGPVTVVTAPETNVAETIVEAAAVTEAETVSIAAPEPAALEPVVVTYAMAEQAYFDREYGEAAALFNRYTDSHPDNAWGFYMLGLSQWKADDAEAADEAFAYALELKSDHFKSLVNHARVLIALDRGDEARVRIERALDIDPASVEAIRVMGRIEHNTGNLEAAETNYENVLRADASDVWALNNLGLILIEQERFDEALAPLAKAASLHRTAACIHNNLGIALERTGHYAAADEAYARALDADPAYAKADASRVRVVALVEAPGTEPVNLESLAASFSVAEPGAQLIAAADTGMEPAPDDMEVAAAVIEMADVEAADNEIEDLSATPEPENEDSGEIRNR